MATGNGYSSAQILAMQKDAIRRVNEMQRTAQEKLRQSERVLSEQTQPEQTRSERVLPTEPVPASQNSGYTVGEPLAVRHVEESSSAPTAERNAPALSGSEPAESPLQGILSRMNLDSETVLLLLILVLLINEGADSKLIMALVYILL